MENLKIIRVKELSSLLGTSISTIYRWEAEGKLPIRKVKFGPNSVGFLKKDVEEWLMG